MTTDEHAHRVAATRDRIKALLERERQQLLDEIRTYPTPIPRCDQQFNHLIAQRDLLAQELARLDAAVGPGVPDSEYGARLDAFIDACACLDADLKLRLQAVLRERALGTAKTLHVPGA
jgi:hypothetical protein